MWVFQLSPNHTQLNYLYAQLSIEQALSKFDYLQTYEIFDGK